jgi:hypothetical protein
MDRSQPSFSSSRALAYGAGLLAGAWATYATATWLRYGHVQEALVGEQDPLLDRFMPVYEVVERHRLRVLAPPGVAYQAACDVDLQRSPLIRAIFLCRERMMAARRDATVHQRGLLALTKSLGWGVLAEVPGREIVVGAVTEPWQPNVVFRALEPHRFAAFDDPGYVKIAWTIRVDPIGPGESLLRTETRVVATDSVARRRFRQYWAIYSPGILVIRYVALRLVKTDAERLVSEPLSEH